MILQIIKGLCFNLCLPSENHDLLVPKSLIRNKDLRELKNFRQRKLDNMYGVPNTYRTVILWGRLNV